MYSPHRSNDVRDQNRQQYDSKFSVPTATYRRAFYDYALPLEGTGRPYNTWEDQASHLDLATARHVVDMGCNDGHFHQVLRHAGFMGRYTGIDIEGKDLPAVEYLAQQVHPDARFVQGNAEDLRGIIETSSADRVVASFLTYHAAHPLKIFEEIHRILERGEIADIATRDVTNQQDTWELIRRVGHFHGFAFPAEIGPNNRFIPNVPIERISVYSHFDTARTREVLQKGNKFRILYEHTQDEVLAIPMTEGGLFDIENVLESLLPYLVSIKDRRRPEEGDIAMMGHFIRTTVRNSIISEAEENKKRYSLLEPHYLSRATQSFFIVQAI